MADTKPSVLDTRREEMFPVLAAAEIDRLRRFGDVRFGSVKCVAVSVGEGAQVADAIHAYLAANGAQEEIVNPARGSTHV